MSRLTHFGSSHPLAEVATQHCRQHSAAFSGDTPCGACWELAIRDDERFVVETGLSRELEVDPSYVDEIAVELACRGQRVRLTPVEFRAAVENLLDRRLTTVQIARRLRTTYTAVAAALDPTAGTVVAASRTRVAA
jgi:hypothetical protein